MTTCETSEAAASQSAKSATCRTCGKEFSGMKVLPTKDKIYEHPVKICSDCEAKEEQLKKSKNAAQTLLAEIDTRQKQLREKMENDINKEERHNADERWLELENLKGKIKGLI